MITRRDLLKSVGVGALAAGLSSKPIFAAAEKVVKMEAMLPSPKGNRVVICGGGWAGLTVAKYLKKENPNIEVILIEKKAQLLLLSHIQRVACRPCKLGFPFP